MNLFVIITFFFVNNALITGKCLQNNEFDYIVVGAGSSGSVVAARLSENSNIKVLLLEAGGKPLPISYIPLLSFQALGSEMDWNYITEPQNDCCHMFKDDVVVMNRGKALGGSSSLNFMDYIRGNKLDFDQWSKLGNPGWDYQSIFHYFLKLEDYQVPHSRYDAPYHSKGGPITVEIPKFKTPLADAFLQSGEEIGQPLVDFNAKYQTGFMYPPITTKNGARCSTYAGYLKPALNRTNLHTLTQALVTKIILNRDKKVTGVLYEKDSTNCSAKARKEVIISAGVFNTPQLLLLSGIGPKETLKKFNIPLVVDLPGVGENLQDHVAIGGFGYTINQTIGFKAERYQTKEYLELWKKSRTGPMTCPGSFEGVAYHKTKYINANEDWPDIEIDFSSDNLAQLVSPLLNSDIDQLLNSNTENDIITFLPLLLRPKSRGYVSLRSTDPHDPPVIDPKYLSHPDDIKVLLEGIKFILKLVETKAFQQYGATLFVNQSIPNCVSHRINTEEYYQCLIKVLSTTAYHPTSTCKMGLKSDKFAVVDHRLRVHHTKNLRVVDASIMPVGVSANTNVACIMIGEKAADMIKEDNHILKP